MNFYRAKFLLMAFCLFLGACQSPQKSVYSAKTSCVGKTWKNTNIIANSDEVQEPARFAGYENFDPKNCSGFEGLKGYVSFYVAVDGNGHINTATAKVLKTNGPDHTRFALQVLPAARFWPACDKGEPVATHIIFTVQVSC